MTIEFFVTDTKTGDRVVVNVEPASVADYKATKDELANPVDIFLYSESGIPKVRIQGGINK